MSLLDHVHLVDLRRSPFIPLMMLDMYYIDITIFVSCCTQINKAPIYANTCCYCTTDDDAICVDQPPAAAHYAGLYHPREIMAGQQVGSILPCSL